ncbi:MAG: hypothetical protein ACR2NP_06440 [Pirellulaceae bacterium]
MSKCDLQIEFYRPDREFRTGETVQGWIRVRVNQDVKCRGLTLNCWWSTHGRGNQTRRNYYQQTLFQGEWKAGEKYEYAFEFQPPASPLSYRGKYLNIDHYVLARVDIPWARDPKCREEFLWRPGNDAPVPDSAEPVIQPGTRRWPMIIGLNIAFILVLLFVFLSAQISPLFLLGLIAPLVIVWFSLRSWLAQRKLGEVKWGTLAQAVAGEPMPSLLQIGPLGNVQISAVTASITGHESVVSGSGTNRTTHSHKLFQQTKTLIKSPASKRGEVIELQPGIIFPMTRAFSVDLPDNKITWTVTLAIRLPMWPDWVQSRVVELLPPPAKRDDDDNPNPAFATQPFHDLIQLVRQLTETGADTPMADKIIQQHADKLYTVAVDIDRVEPAEEGFEDLDYLHGNTLNGTLTGTRLLVSVQLPARYNQEVEHLDRGESFSCSGALLRWDHLRSRIVILGI